MRGTGPARLTKLLRGELDWIVMKALEKERARRLQETANGLADVEHYLNDETVEACPPSATYGFGKFLRRYRTLLAAFVTFVSLISICLVISTGLALWAMDAEVKARIEREKAIEATRAATKESERAKKEAERAYQAEKVATDERNRAVAAEVQAMNNLAGLYNAQGGRLSEAEPLYRQAIRWSAAHPGAGTW